MQCNWCVSLDSSDNTTSERPIMLMGEGLEEVESFRYLGSIVDRGGTEADVKTRISKARAALHIF